MSGDRKIRVGSRKSELALIQTRHVISRLQEINPEKEFEIVTMSTLGDKVLDIPLPKIGEKSLFTKELETALATGYVDFVVHSLKDLPTCLPDGMAIGAVLEREDPRDALVLQKDLKDFTLQTLPQGSVVGTSSLRRSAQISRKYPHLKIEDIRGNLNTRLRKLDELGKFQAIILAFAGLQRMGWEDRVSKVIETEELMYAIGQGALAVECRENDEDTLKLLSTLYDPKTALQVITERAFLQTLGGGCSAPVAICANISNLEGSKHNIHVTGGVWSLDGKDELTETLERTLDLKKLKTCPYNNKCRNFNNNSKSCCLKVGSNESRKDCCGKAVRPIECCLNQSDDSGDHSKRKRLRTESTSSVSSEKSIPLDLLDNDPHKHCPVQIPIGADFMGKCPFLELKTESTNPNHVNINIENADISKCPYFKQNTSRNEEGPNSSCQSTSEINKNVCPHMNRGTLEVEKNANNIINASNINDNLIIDLTSENVGKHVAVKPQLLFSGLVAHKQLPIRVLEEARDLGKDLANKLISKGALDIMAKAQAHIRSS